jgi:hypothetical protein
MTDTAKPEVVLASAINETQEGRPKPFDLSAHGVRVSIRCIWVEKALLTIRYA